MCRRIRGCQSNYSISVFFNFSSKYKRADKNGTVENFCMVLLTWSIVQKFSEFLLGVPWSLKGMEKNDNKSDFTEIWQGLRLYFWTCGKNWLCSWFKKFEQGLAANPRRAGWNRHYWREFRKIEQSFVCIPQSLCWKLMIRLNPFETTDETSHNAIKLIQKRVWWVGKCIPVILSVNGLANAFPWCWVWMGQQTPSRDVEREWVSNRDVECEWVSKRLPVMLNVNGSANAFPWCWLWLDGYKNTIHSQLKGYILR